MDVLYARSDGKLKYEHVNPKFRWIQEPDGDHQITKEVIQHDIEGILDPIVWIWQDIPEPDHPGDRAIFIRPSVVEAEQCKKHHLKKMIGKSRLSIRSFISAIGWGFRAFYFFLFLVGMYIFGVFIWALIGVLT